MVCLSFDSLRYASESYNATVLTTFELRQNVVYGNTLLGGYPGGSTCMLGHERSYDATVCARLSVGERERERERRFTCLAYAPCFFWRMLHMVLFSTLNVSWLKTAVLGLTGTRERYPSTRHGPFWSWPSRTNAVFHCCCEAPLPETLWRNHTSQPPSSSTE